MCASGFGLLKGVKAVRAVNKRFSALDPRTADWSMAHACLTQIRCARPQASLNTCLQLSFALKLAFGLPLLYSEMDAGMHMYA